MTNTQFQPIQKTQSLITGAIASNGSFTDKSGKEVKYDSIKFYVQMSLTKGKGFATVEYKLKNRSHDFEKIFGNIELPAVAEISSIEQTDGKGSTIKEITDIAFIKKGVANVQ